MARPTSRFRARYSRVDALRLFSICALVIALPAIGTAQEPADVDSPAHVAFVDGTAILERDGRPDTAPANMPLLAGDRVRTQSGRVEILFADGSTLHLDTNTTVDFQSDELVRLLDGRVRLTISGASRAVSYRIDAPGAWAQITEPGEYRLSILRGFRPRAEATGADTGVEVELAVLRGAAELVNEDGRTPIRAGERAFARVGVAPSYAYVFNSAAWDAFDRWSEERRDYRLGLSSQYLPEQVRPYSRAFDTYGTWRHEPTYGYVWYPTAHLGWRPYYHGRWASLRPWGWTWIGADPWAWPTHHFGRWGFSAGAWFWIPGRRWGPAWVSWAYAPGYVSWCPLGWNNRPIVQIVNVNVFSRRHDPWFAWTVVSRRHFGVGVVHANVVSRHVIDTRLRGTFVHRDTAPEVVGHAVPRSAAPIRVAGTRRDPGDPRRGDPTVYTNLGPDASRVRTPGARVTVNAPPASSPSRAVPRTSVGAPVAGAGAPPSDVASGTAPRQRALPRPDVGTGSAQRNRAVPRANAGSGPAPEERAFSRSRDIDVPRAMPDRPAVRSRPRGDASPGDTDGGPARRAVPRAIGPGAAPAPVHPDSGREMPTYRRVPSAPSRIPDSPIYREPSPGEVGRPPMRSRDRSIERSAPASPSGPPPGSRAIPRSEGHASPQPPPERVSPYRGGGHRSAPGGAPPSGGGTRAVPRATPDAGPGRSEPRGGAPAARPRGGDGGGAPRRR